MNILDKITAKKRETLAVRKLTASEDEVREKALELVKSGKSNNKATQSFFDALSQKGEISIIAEVKKASPSRGVISEEFDYMNIARNYEASGAAAISVLTEEDFFLGSDQYFSEIVSEVSIPLLRKDFVIDEYQIYESKILGASAILLIMMILSDDEVTHFYNLATSLGMDCLFEAHDEEEAMRAVRLGAKIVGINNRDLRDFTIDIKNTEKMIKRVPDGILKVSESGIFTAEDIEYLDTVGVDAALIGESLMKSESVGAKLGELRLGKE